MVIQKLLVSNNNNNKVDLFAVEMLSFKYRLFISEITSLFYCLGRIFYSGGDVYCVYFPLPPDAAV